MRARACVAAALTVLAAPIALAGTLEACRTALPEAACDADLSRERIRALREATYQANPAPNPAAAPAKP
ncbi:hypothetical protein [Ralstonia pseudosolanacearum]|uniref:hypothetical protein n=1 Tax=Ralstonia pseudosolanacearum TaxID=1310165 RepID=UPI00223490CC|nr:hypothetical protein [Ralstonia sp. RS647]UZF34484.1 hypothetical protein LGV81_14675 [Ralstonia sp. RS647]